MAKGLTKVPSASDSFPQGGGGVSKRGNEEERTGTTKERIHVVIQYLENTSRLKNKPGNSWKTGEKKLKDPG